MKKTAAAKNFSHNLESNMNGEDIVETMRSGLNDVKTFMETMEDFLQHDQINLSEEKKESWQEITRKIANLGMEFDKTYPKEGEKESEDDEKKPGIWGKISHTITNIIKEMSDLQKIIAKSSLSDDMKTFANQSYVVLTDIGKIAAIITTVGFPAAIPLCIKPCYDLIKDCFETAKTGYKLCKTSINICKEYRNKVPDKENVCQNLQNKYSNKFEEYKQRYPEIYSELKQQSSSQNIKAQATNQAKNMQEKFTNSSNKSDTKDEKKPSYTPNNKNVRRNTEMGIA